EGVRLDRNLPPEAAAPAVRGRGRLNLAIIALLVLALTVSITFNVVDLPVGSRAAPRSIAVLPFRSLSSEPEPAAFVEGIHDDLLTRLASIRSLKVISPTSVME